MINGIVDTLKNPDMSAWEKFLSIGSSILMMVTMIVPAFTSLITTFGATGAAGAGAAAGIGAVGVSSSAATPAVTGFGVAL
jgi:hypothetical protein